MARQIIWSETAWADLEQVADYIARESPAYAASFVQLVVEKARSLAEFSERGSIVPEIGQSSVREAFVFNYRIIYSIEPTQVRILALVHGARDLPKYLQQRSEP